MKTYLLKNGVQIIGRAGEQGVIRVAVDVGNWQEQYTDGVGGLMATCPGGARYPLAVEIDGSMMIATLPQECTDRAGRYDYTATWTLAGSIVISQVYPAIILTSEVERGMPPVDIHNRTPDWAKEIYIKAEQILNNVDAALQAEQSVLDARDDAQEAQAAAETAQEAAETAEEGAGAAQEAAETAQAGAEQALEDAVTAKTAAQDAAASATAAYGTTLLAPTFSADAAYSAGQHIVYGGNLYVFTADHAAGAWTGTDASQVVLGNELGALKSAITANTGTEILPVTETGEYIEIVTDTAVTKTSANFKYIKYACSAGDVFTINAVGAGGAIAYGFIDASDGVLLRASQNTEYHDTVITAPANSAYLIVNNRVTNDYISYKGIPLINQIAPVFSASANYPANAVVIYGGKLYQFNIRHAAGTWTGSDVTEKPLSDLFVAEFSNKDILPNNTDANTVLKTGFWNLSSTSTYNYTNIPVSHVNSCLVLICMTTMPVASGNVARAFQMLIDITHNNVYQRIYNSGAGWAAWQILNAPSAYEIAKNPVFTTISHGGFFTRTQEDQHYQQDSPLAFKRAAQAGIYNHEVDIAFSSDGVPLVAHNNTFTDTNGVSHTIYLETAAQLQAVQKGDSSYSWTIMTLAQADAYIKKLGGRIYMVDVSAPRGDYDTFSTNNAAALPGYYRANNINPVWTNWDAQLHLNAFVAAGAEFGVAFVCETESSITTALTYIASNPDIKYALCLWLTTGGIAPATAKTYVTQIREAGAAIIAYLYSVSTLSDVPMWADGVLSEDTNISYKLYEAVMYG